MAGDQANDLIRSLLESDAIPHEDGDPTFERPWQARAFGLAVAMREGPVEWQSFQQRLADEIATGDSTANPDAVEEEYYRRWLAALERLMIDGGHLTEEQLSRRTAEFADGDRTAAEFVEGEHEH